MNRRLANAIFLVFLLWTMMFSPWTSANIHLVGALISAAVLLAAIAFWFSHRDGQPHPLLEYARSLSTGSKVLHIGLGLVTIAVLAVLSPKALLFACVGIAEEIFWRGYVQQRLGFVATTLLYAGVYAVSMNQPLMLTALGSGALFGGIYQRYPHYYPAVVIGHAIWNITLLIGYPLIKHTTIL